MMGINQNGKPEVIVKVAMTPSRVMGVSEKNELPWRAIGENLAGDLLEFKETTIGDGNNALIYGRRTLESFRNKALPNRKNFVLSRKEEYTAPENITRFFDLDSAIAAASDCDQIFIIGGADLIAEALKKNLVSKMMLTITYKEYDGDIFFPKYDTVKWKQIRRSSFPQKDMRYERVVLVPIIPFL
jgi:dihydrofolate reductase